MFGPGLISLVNEGSLTATFHYYINKCIKFIRHN